VAANAAAAVPSTGLYCALISVSCSGPCRRIRGTHCRLPLLMLLYFAFCLCGSVRSITAPFVSAEAVPLLFLFRTCCFAQSVTIIADVGLLLWLLSLPRLSWLLLLWYGHCCSDCAFQASSWLQLIAMHCNCPVHSNCNCNCPVTSNCNCNCLVSSNYQLQDPRILLNSVSPGYHSTKSLYMRLKLPRRYRNSAEL
jgi:hypothetical protein